MGLHNIGEERIIVIIGILFLADFEDLSREIVFMLGQTF